jgi:DNA-binding transcriptional ArsR family regulator
VSPAGPASALEALGDANRRAILEIIAGGPVSVQAIADRLTISRPAVSRHLRLLKAAELVDDEAVGTRRIYRLRAEGVEAVRAYFEQLWGEAATRYRLAVENVGDPQDP